jgi:ClpP class serine protease
MRAEFVSKVCSTVLDLPKLRARTIVANIAMRSLRPRGQGDDDAEELSPNAPKMQIIGNVAVIQMVGVIWMNVPDSAKRYFVDANDIEELINRALRDENVQLIVFDVNSPGGWDLASLKLFELVEAANRKKPCFAFCADGCDMASGAYYAVAATTAIYAGWYADGVGCVGCYLAWLDDTEFWAQMGIKFEVFREGELKGMGIDSLSEPQRAYLQNMVSESGERFRKNVLKYRSGIALADLEGQWFMGSEAAKRGFVAGCVDNLEAAIAKFRRML